MSVPPHSLSAPAAPQELLALLRPLASSLCHCGFLYFLRQLLPAALSDLFSRPSEAPRLPYLLAAFGDTSALLRQGGCPAGVVAAHEAELRSVLLAAVVAPLCTEAETDLRLHLHSARLAGAVEVSPDKTGVRDLAPFLLLPPLRCGSWQLRLSAHVTRHLNAAFYNHCAVALHDWKTYGEMRCLAREKWNLRLDELTLPGQTLEQGLDCLEIMRNIHLFVARFTYNMNMQMFCERPAAAADRKHLNVVAIRHVANSIRTHGTGIMNTTVNFVYQFLSQKLQIFSQFLFDDHIRSRLLKEARFVAAATRPQQQRVAAAAGGGGQLEYPTERALKFNTGARTSPRRISAAHRCVCPQPTLLMFFSASASPLPGPQTYASWG